MLLSDCGCFPASQFYSRIGGKPGWHDSSCTAAHHSTEFFPLSSVPTHRRVCETYRRGGNQSWLSANRRKRPCSGSTSSFRCLTPICHVANGHAWYNRSARRNTAFPIRRRPASARLQYGNGTTPTLRRGRSIRWLLQVDRTREGGVPSRSRRSRSCYVAIARSRESR